MSDPKHPTNRDWVLNDPLIDQAPAGVSLMLINAGGSLVIGLWTDDCLAWGKKPIIPASVKARQSEKMRALMRQNSPPACKEAPDARAESRD